MTIGIVADHRGFKLKQRLTKYLKQKKYDVIDYTPNFIPLDDYTDSGIMLGEKLMTGAIDYGIAICANGVGMSIACNKVKGIRCAKINTAKEAASARRDDDINIMALPADLAMIDAKDIVDAFIKTKFSTIDRYSRRIAKLNAYENGEVYHEC